VLIGILQLLLLAFAGSASFSGCEQPTTPSTCEGDGELIIFLRQALAVFPNDFSD
jgi:hypothetical protein